MEYYQTNSDNYSTFTDHQTPNMDAYDIQQQLGAVIAMSQIESNTNGIKTHKHLPCILTAQEVSETGLKLGEMNQKLLQKIEELTLYIIQQQKEINTLKLQIQRY